MKGQGRQTNRPKQYSGAMNRQKVRPSENRQNQTDAKINRVKSGNSRTRSVSRISTVTDTLRRIERKWVSGYIQCWTEVRKAVPLCVTDSQSQGKP